MKLTAVRPARAPTATSGAVTPIDMAVPALPAAEASRSKDREKLESSEEDALAVSALRPAIAPSNDDVSMPISKITASPAMSLPS